MDLEFHAQWANGNSRTAVKLSYVKQAISNKVLTLVETKANRIGILSPKLFWPTVRNKCSSDREKLLKFEAECREFATFLRSLEQFIQTVKGQNNFW